MCVCVCVFACCRNDRQPFPLNMPAVKHLTVLVSLFAVWADATTTVSEIQVQQTTTIAALPTSLAVTTKNDVTPNHVQPISNTQEMQSTTNQITTAVPSPSTSLPSPNRTEETHPSPPTATNQTSNETVSHGPTFPPASESPNATETTTTTTTINTISPGISHDWGKGDLAANPGLVAILCIFCIVLALVLVVVTVKCIRSPRSNFERLDDVPMGKMSEESPFAHYSK
ncbi:mucin-3B [Dicentrarchus labrax]|uniref:mucin-3B n=1 Tax=Dicentrarchus labrax TaxID=13489 RepID=UPI0021F61EB4|nr:mucin-3B [Dicentrarchus labrax]